MPAIFPPPARGGTVLRSAAAARAEIVTPLNSEHETTDLVVAAELAATDDAARGMVAEIGAWFRADGQRRD
jgi:hypothetical protein